MKKKKKMTVKDKLLNILKSHKTIIYLSFFINIILIFFSYNLITSNHEYTFSGSDEYIRIDNGLIVLNNDLNLIYGNDINYINNNDYEIKHLKLGYYILEENNDLKELISKEFSFEEGLYISEVIKNFTSFNYTEKSNNKTVFTDYNVNQLNNGLYFVLEAKTNENQTIECQINLNLTKISKF